MLKFKFWGVRGSIPAPGPDYTEIGGNTSCIEVINNENELLIIDAGTGIRPLGQNFFKKYDKKGIRRCSILLSHTHWDHIQGFPFFAPIYIKDFEVKVYGPVRRNQTLDNILSGQMNYTYYPVKLSDLKAKIEFHELNEKEFHVGAYKITPKILNHPVKTYGYKIEYEDKVITTLFDHEIYRNILKSDKLPEILSDLKVSRQTLEQASLQAEHLNREIIDFTAGSNYLICDAHFNEDEYSQGKQGWGHGPIEYFIEHCRQLNGNNIILTHHAPEKSDHDVYKMHEKLKSFAKSKSLNLNLIIAKEGLELEL